MTPVQPPNEGDTLGCDTDAACASDPSLLSPSAQQSSQGVGDVDKLTEDLVRDMPTEFDAGTTRDVAHYNASALLSSFTERNLLKLYWGKLENHVRQRLRLRVHEMHKLLQLHLKSSKEKGLLLRKMKLRNDELKGVWERDRGASAAVTKQLNEARLSLSYAQQNFIMDQVEFDSKALKAIQREVEPVLHTPIASAPVYCKACFVTDVRANSSQPLRRLKSPDRSPSGGEYQTLDKKTGWARFDPQKKRELIMQQMVNNLRKHVEALKQQGEERRRVAKDSEQVMYGLHSVYKDDIELNEKVRTALSQGDDPECTRVKDRLVSVCSQVTFIKQSVLELRRVVADNLARATDDAFGHHNVIMQLVDRMRASSTTAEPLLFKFDAFYHQWRVFMTSLKIPWHLSSEFTRIEEGTTDLLAMDWQNHTAKVLQTVSERFMHIQMFMMDLVSAVARQVKLAEDAEKAFGALSLESQQLRQQIEALDSELRSLKAVNKMQHCVEVVRRRQSETERPRARRKSSVVPKRRSPEQRRVTRPRLSFLEVEEEAQQHPPAPPVPLEPGPEPSPAPVAVTPLDPSDEEPVKVACVETGVGVFDAVVESVTIGTNTIEVRDAETSIRPEELGKARREVAPVMLNVSSQTVKVLYTTETSQTPVVPTRDAATGITTTETGTGTADVGCYPEHVDGCTSTYSTFCLAPSKHLEESKAYTEVRYVCKDEQKSEERTPDDLPGLLGKNVRTSKHAAHLVTQLKAAMKVALQRIDYIRCLSTEYSRLHTSLDSEERAASAADGNAVRWEVNADPANGHSSTTFSLPVEVQDVVDETSSFNPEVSYSYMPLFRNMIPSPHPSPAPPPSNKASFHVSRKRLMSPGASAKTPGGRRSTTRPTSRSCADETPTHEAVLRRERRREKRKDDLPRLRHKPLVSS